MPPAAESAFSLLGKVPSCAEFVRSGPYGEPEAGLVCWLDRALEQNGGLLPQLEVRFVISADPRSAPLVGVWVPSADQLGRSYPLVFAHKLDADVASQWFVVPSLYRGLLEAAAARLARATTQPFSELQEAVRSLEPPHPIDVPRLLHRAQALLGTERGSALAQRAFGRSAEDALPYALMTLAEATSGPGVPSLEMPLSAERDLLIWLELLRRLLPESAQPSAVFWSVPSGRLLFDLERPSELTVAFLRDREHPSQRRWPTWTSSANASQVARAQLGRRTWAALERDATLAELFAAFESEVAR